MTDASLDQRGVVKGSTLPMLPVLSFHCAAHFGIEKVFLGDAMIGNIQQLGEMYRIALWLPGPSRGRRAPRSGAEARAIFVDAVNDWLLRAGIFYPGQSVEVAQVGGAAAADRAVAENIEGRRA